MIISKNHNSLDCEQSLGLDIKQSPNAQDTFRPIPGLISYAGVIRSVGVVHVLGITPEMRTPPIACYLFLSKCCPE